MGSFEQRPISAAEIKTKRSGVVARSYPSRDDDVQREPVIADRQDTLGAR